MYDDNKITIEGTTDIAFTENVEARFKAYGWQVLRVESSEDLAALEAAVKEAQADHGTSQSDYCTDAHRFWQSEAGQSLRAWRTFGRGCV